MAVANRTATTANSGAAAATSLVLNKPTSTAAGDLLVTTISINGGTGSTVTTLSGWTLLTRTNSTTVLGQGVYYRVADGTEGSTFTWSCTSAFVAGVCNAYTGVDNTNPIAGFTALAKTTASTAATFGACIPQAESVYGVLCVTSRNTTGTTTMTTASTGYTNDGDTCTTATTFIQANHQDQHTAYGLPLTSVTAGSGTFSRSVTDIDTILFLRPTVATITGGFAIDVSTFASELTDTGGTVTTAPFSTGYANEIIWAIIAGDSGASSVMTVSGGGLTWHAASTFTNARQNTFVYWALASSPVSGITVTTADTGNTSSSWGVHIVSMTGVNTTSPFGASAQKDPNATGAFTQAITTTAANSWVWLAWNNYSANTTPTVGTSQTKVNDIANANDGNRYSTTRQTAVTASSGTSVTMSNTAPTVSSAGIVFEIMAASTGVSASVTQVAATVTATGGTQAVSAIVVTNASVAQVAATVTATGGTQTVSGVVKASVSISQVAATVTATGGTQAVATTRIVNISQSAATVTATGGTQVVGLRFSANVIQVAATVTVSGGLAVVVVSTLPNTTWTPEVVNGAADFTPEVTPHAPDWTPEATQNDPVWHPEATEPGDQWQNPAAPNSPPWNRT